MDANRPSGLTPYFEVFDMIESVRFYRDVLGFAVTFSSPEVDTKEGTFSHFVRLRFGEFELMLNTAYDSNERPERRNESRWAGHADVVLYIDCPDVDALHGEFTERGLNVPPPKTASYGIRYFQITDPDNYRLTFRMPA
jgi:glyoxylase I family protein